MIPRKGYNVDVIEWERKELIISIDLVNSAGLQIYEQPHIFHDVVPEAGNEMSNDAIKCNYENARMHVK